MGNDFSENYRIINKETLTEYKIKDLWKIYNKTLDRPTPCHLTKDVITGEWYIICDGWSYKKIDLDIFKVIES